MAINEKYRSVNVILYPVFELDHVLKPSGKFPATYRYLFLKSIGLDCEEAIHLMFKPKLSFATQARKSDVQSLIHQRSTLPNPNRRIEEEDNHRKISSEDFVKELGYTHPIYVTLMRERFNRRRVELEGLPPMEKWTRLKEEDPRDDRSKSESQPTRGHDKVTSRCNFEGYFADLFAFTSLQSHKWLHTKMRTNSDTISRHSFSCFFTWCDVFCSEC